MRWVYQSVAPCERENKTKFNKLTTLAPTTPPRRPMSHPAVRQGRIESVNAESPTVGTSVTKAHAYSAVETKKNADLASAEPDPAPLLPFHPVLAHEL